MSYCRAAFAAGALALGLILTSAPAPASVEMVDGARTVVQNAPLGDCSAKAKGALSIVLKDPFEAGAGTGMWLAYGKADSNGYNHASASILCYPVDSGYVATFTCAVQVPSDAGTASDLCTKLSAAFDATKPAAAQGSR